MSLRVSEVVIDCADQYVALTPRENAPGRPPILFQKVPEPKVVKNRVHLDFRTESRVDEIARLVRLGATVLREGSLGSISWTVMADPEDNDFCVSDGG